MNTLESIELKTLDTIGNFQRPVFKLIHLSITTWSSILEVKMNYPIKVKEDVGINFKMFKKSSTNQAKFPVSSLPSQQVGLFKKL